MVDLTTLAIPAYIVLMAVEVASYRFLPDEAEQGYKVRDTATSLAMGLGSIAANLGYRPIFWTADSGDWTFEATADGVRRRVLDNAGNGSIIVMHFESPRTRSSTAVVLPTIIDTLRERGYRLVTITELVTGILDEDR